MYILLELYKTHDVHLKLRLTLQTSINNICITPGLHERNFCDGLAMNLASPFGGIQQAGALETAAKNVTPCFYLRLMITYG